MNQQEYNLIAGVVSRWYKLFNVPYMQYDGLVSHFADMLEVTYPKTFDRSKFLKSCGLEEV